jgi:hypothetical protein
MKERERLMRLRKVSGADVGRVVGYQNLKHDTFNGVGVVAPDLVNRWIPHSLSHRESASDRRFGANQILTMEFGYARMDRYTGGSWWGVSGRKGTERERKLKMLASAAEARLLEHAVQLRGCGGDDFHSSKREEPWALIDGDNGDGDGDGDKDGDVLRFCPAYHPPRARSKAALTSKQQHRKHKMQRPEEEGGEGVGEDKQGVFQFAPQVAGGIFQSSAADVIASFNTRPALKVKHHPHPERAQHPQVHRPLMESMRSRRWAAGLARGKQVASRWLRGLGSYPEVMSSRRLAFRVRKLGISSSCNETVMARGGSIGLWMSQGAGASRMGS